MNRDSLARMRLDRRLLTRRGWISKKEVAAALSELPDVADKAITLGQAAGNEDGADADHEEASSGA